MVLEYLKVKILSLAEEAKIIRKMEQKRKRKAQYARDHVHMDRRIAWHTKQIERLRKARTEETAVGFEQWMNQNHELAERQQFHQLEIMRLKRQHNLTHVTQKTVEYNEKVNVGLHLHRIHDIRSEARAAYIAYAFLRGFAYEDIETNVKTYPKWDRVRDLVWKYGEWGTPQERLDALAKWAKEAGLSDWCAGLISCPPGSSYQQVRDKMKALFGEKI